MLRYFYDLKNDKILNWNEICKLFIDDLQYYIMDDEDGEYETYCMKDYIDDEIQMKNIAEFEDLLDDEYMFDIRSVKLNNILAIGESNKFVSLSITIRKLLDNSNYAAIQNIIDDGDFTDDDGNFWYCDIIDKDLLFY